MIKIDPNKGLEVGMVISSPKIKVRRNKGENFGDAKFVVTNVQKIPNEAQIFGYGAITAQLMTPEGNPDPQGKTVKFHAPVIHMYNDEIRLEDIVVHEQLKQTFV